VKRTIPITVFAFVAIFSGLAACGRADRPAPAASDIGGPFQLVSDTGARVDERLLKGKWSVVYFGYTFCPDVCPTTLAQLGAAEQALGARARAFQVVFITVDPVRDTPAALHAYLAQSQFPKGAVGLTGSETQIRAATGVYHVYYARQGAGANYSVDHTSILYLMDPEGRFVRPVTPGPPANMAGQIEAAMDGR
jgi:protein SCO1/2